MWKSLLENIQGIVLMVGLGFLALEDIKTHKIRSMSIIVFALVGAILSFLNGNWFDWRLILGFIPGIIVLFLGLLTKETIGYGDGLVVLALGCYLNIFEIIGLSMLALTLAGLEAVFLIVVYHKGKKELSFIRKEWKASYTVEAAFVVPILLSAMLVAMLIGLDLYEDVKGEQEQEKIMQMWQVKEFYKYQIVNEVIKYES